MSAAPQLSKLQYTVSVEDPKGEKTEQRFERSILIGRAAENDLVISNDPKVSRKHVKLLIEDGQLKVTNLSPKNPITIDGKTATDFFISKDQCLIELGGSKIKIAVKPSYGKAEPVPVLSDLKKASPLAPRSNPLSPHGHSMPAGSPQPIYPGQQAVGPVAAPKKKTKKKVRARRAQKPNRIPMIIALIIIGAVAVLLMEDDKKSSTPESIRSAQEREEDLARVQMQIDEQRRTKEESGQASKMYEKAQEYYIRGFRDYRQGQFRRAMLSFQATLSFYPDHVLARKYLRMAEVQADKTDRLNMQQGQKYKSRGNYSLCASSFQKVMTSIKDPENAVYKEAKLLYEACSAMAGDKY